MSSITTTCACSPRPCRACQTSPSSASAVGVKNKQTYIHTYIHIQRHIPIPLTLMVVNRWSVSKHPHSCMADEYIECNIDDGMLAQLSRAIRHTPCLKILELDCKALVECTHSRVPPDNHNTAQPTPSPTRACWIWSWRSSVCQSSGRFPYSVSCSYVHRHLLATLGL